VLALVTTGHAQTKFSGKMQCAKPDPNFIAPVGDPGGHVLALSKYKCAWTQGEVAGIRAKGEEGTGVLDMRGNAGHEHGYAVATWADGDTTVSRYEGTMTLKDNAPISSQGTWRLMSGTGRLKSIEGGGAYTGKFNSDGTSTFDVEGQYRLPTITTGK